MYFDAENFFLLAMLMIGSLTDIKTSRIPNLLTIPCALVGMTVHTCAVGIDGFLFSLSGWAAGVGLLILPYYMSGMGAGDVKFMGAVGSFLGAKATFEAFLIIALFGGVYAIILIIIHREVFKGFLREKLMWLISVVIMRQYIPIQTETESSGQKPRLKYGVAIALGTITYLLSKSIGSKLFV
jgi:prepilin peptidase CpaA